MKKFHFLTRERGQMKCSSAVLLGFLLFLTACGGGDQNAPTELALLAGNLDDRGNVDGIGAMARFSAPTGLAVDSAGNVYVADTGNNTIRKITPAGEVSTFAGRAGTSGDSDGLGAAALLYSPAGLVTDSAGNVYVIDANHRTSVRKITPNGGVTTLASLVEAYFSVDDAPHFFDGPSVGITADSAGNIYLPSDLDVIFKIAPTGDVTIFAGSLGVSGSVDGPAGSALFNRPSSIATDSAGNMYVADTGNSVIRKVTPTGDVTTLAGTAGTVGSADGAGATASFSRPKGISIDTLGNIYVADTGNSTIRKITPAGDVITLAGTAGSYGAADGFGAAARFLAPVGVTTDSAGNVYVADTFNNAIRKITPAGEVTTLAGAPGASGSLNGVGAAATFSKPKGVTADDAGNVYIADTNNSTIRKITASGVVTTLAGAPPLEGGDHTNTDGFGAAARFSFPTGLATDSTGTVYVADTANNTIRKISPSGIVTTFAGKAGTSGSSDGAGVNATFNDPEGIAIDSGGNVYVADFINHTIRKITPAGEVTTFAGMAGQYGSSDGVGSSARLIYPLGVATDSLDNVYVTEGSGIIRKITPDGQVTTLAGTAQALGSADGVGAAARFNNPRGIATDASGNIYVADTGNHTIRKITPNGVVSTVVGVAGQASFAPGPLPGLLSSPEAVAISGKSLYIVMANGVAVVRNLP